MQLKYKLHVVSLVFFLIFTTVFPGCTLGKAGSCTNLTFTVAVAVQICLVQLELTLDRWRSSHTGHLTSTNSPRRSARRQNKLSH